MLSDLVNQQRATESKRMATNLLIWSCKWLLCGFVCLRLSDWLTLDGVMSDWVEDLKWNTSTLSNRECGASFNPWAGATGEPNDVPIVKTCPHGLATVNPIRSLVSNTYP